MDLITGDGKTALNIISCYGVPKDWQLNDELFQLIVKYTIKLGNVPLILAGDFNFELDSQESYALAVLNEIIAKRLVDVDQMMARLRGDKPVARFYDGSMMEALGHNPPGLMAS